MGAFSIRAEYAISRDGGLKASCEKKQRNLPRESKTLLFMLRPTAEARFTRRALLASSTGCFARMLVEADVRPCKLVGNAKQRIKATLEPVSKVINGVYDIPRVSLGCCSQYESECPVARSCHPISQPFDHLHNEVDTITRYSVIYFRFLWVTSMVVRAAQGRESELSRLCADQCCKDIPRIFTVQYESESTSE